MTLSRSSWQTPRVLTISRTCAWKRRIPARTRGPSPLPELASQIRKLLSTSMFTFIRTRNWWWALTIHLFSHIFYHIYSNFQANSAAACQRACEIESEFLCRSYLYLGPPGGEGYNCRLYHMDHWTLPDGPSTFLLNDRPLIDNGGRIGTFYENRCKSKSHPCCLTLQRLHTVSCWNVDLPNIYLHRFLQ